MRGARGEGRGEGGASHAGKDTPRFFEKQHAGLFFRAEGAFFASARGAAAGGCGARVGK